MPQQLLSQIDRVFDHLAQKAEGSEERPKKRRKLAPAAEELQGGFILDDGPPDAEASLRSDVSANEKDRTDTILLSMVPDALQLLDLPPDDPEVLSVFRNAASGWSNQNQIPGDLGEGDVTRADFRSVCLVLLGGDDDDMEVEETEPLLDVHQDSNFREEESDRAPSDVYEESSLTSPSEDEEDDYQDSDFDEVQPKSKGKGRKTRRGSGSDLDLSSKSITSRQKQVCLEAFHLFFPSVKSNDLHQQKIGIKDLTRAAESIKERIKADDVLEMLKEFSSSPDKSMSLDDFQKMMLAAKLA